jgi:hypothetical protein
MPKQEPDLHRTVLSITLAMDSLRDQCELVDQHRAQLEAAIAERDRLISDALTNGISYRRISSVTGLSKQRLWRISVETPAPEEQ